MEQPIKTTLGALVVAEPALTALAALKLPVRTAYRVAKLCTLVTAETQHFHAQRIACIKELGTERAATAQERAQFGETVTSVLRENLQAFQQRLEELAAVPVEIPWRPVTLEELGAIDIAAADLVALGALVTDDPVAGATLKA